MDFVVVRGGSWWFVMVHCHGSMVQWFVMVRQWFTVMVRHGSSWLLVHCHGSSWFVNCHGSSWLSNWFSWFTVMVRHGSSFSEWFVMVRDVLFSKILQKTCDPLLSQIHYQISFLMRLLIFPFPFKHTSKELC